MGKLPPCFFEEISVMFEHNLVIFIRASYNPYSTHGTQNKAESSEV